MVIHFFNVNWKIVVSIFALEIPFYSSHQWVFTFKITLKRTIKCIYVYWQYDNTSDSTNLQLYCMFLRGHPSRMSSKNQDFQTPSLIFSSSTVELHQNNNIWLVFLDPPPGKPDILDGSPLKTVVILHNSVISFPCHFYPFYWLLQHTLHMALCMICHRLSILYFLLWWGDLSTLYAKTRKKINGNLE